MDYVALPRLITHVRFGSLADIQPVRAMSALPLIADIQRMSWHVRFVP